MEGYIGQIMLWAGTSFIPVDWLECNGQKLSIKEYTALYSLIGINYGGDAVNNFLLPDLRSRVPVGYNPSDADFRIPGQTGGKNSQTITMSSNIALTTDNLPAHTHVATFNPSANISIPAVNASANTKNPDPTVSLAIGAYGGDDVNIYSNATPNTTLKPISMTGTSISVANTGAGKTIPIVMSGTFDNKQQYLTLRYIICVNGMYPARP